MSFFTISSTKDTISVLIADCDIPRNIFKTVPPEIEDDKEDMEVELVEVVESTAVELVEVVESTAVELVEVVESAEVELVEVVESAEVELVEVVESTAAGVSTNSREPSLSTFSSVTEGHIYISLFLNSNIKISSNQ